jgi:hypothetical protein
VGEQWVCSQPRPERLPGLINIKKNIENGQVEIVDLPIEKAWWIFP